MIISLRVILLIGWATQCIVNFSQLAKFVLEWESNFLNASNPTSMHWFGFKDLMWYFRAWLLVLRMNFSALSTNLIVAKYTHFHTTLDHMWTIFASLHYASLGKNVFQHFKQICSNSTHDASKLTSKILSKSESERTDTFVGFSFKTTKLGSAFMAQTSCLRFIFCQGA